MFLLPFNFLRFEAAYFTASDFLCLTSIGLRLLSGGLPLRPFGAGTPFWLFGGALMAGAMLLSSILFGDAQRGFIVTAQYLYTFHLIPLVVLGRDWRRTIALVYAFVLAIVVMCVFGVYLIHIDGQTHTRFVSGSGRLRSFIERSNECASVIAMTAPLILWRFEAGRLRRLTTMCLIGLCIYATMLTGSNSGLAALIFAVGCFLLFALTPKRLVLATLASAAAVAALLIVGRDYLPPVFRERVLSALESGDLEQAGTFGGRLALMLESIDLADRAMVLGMGADRYRVLSAWEAPVHNAYLLIWNEGGLLALVGFAVILLGFAIAGLEAAARAGGRIHTAAAVCTLAPFALLINAAPHVYGRFWVGPILCGLAIARAFAESGPPPSLGVGRAASPRVAR